MMKCPLCETTTEIKVVEEEKFVHCPTCGAVKDVNPNSGNVVWMKNGRVALAEEDVKQQQLKHLKRYGFI